MVKRVFKVYVTKRQKELVDRLCQILGTDYSGLFEHLLSKYMEDMSVVKERLLCGEEVPDRP